MPKKSSRVGTRTRRSHALGGCKTCRRRHVKCDQRRPACQRCQKSGVACEGFSEEVRWMSSSERQGSPSRALEEHRTTRHHLYTEHTRISMGAALSVDLVSGSIDASLDTIEERLCDPSVPSGEDIRVGPFTVFRLGTGASERHSSLSESTTEALNALPCTDDSSGKSIAAFTATCPSWLNIGPVDSTDNLLQWSDLFGFNSDYAGISDPFLDMADCLPSTCDPCPPFLETSLCEPSSMVYKDERPMADQRQGIPTNPPNQTTTPSVDVLRDASFLLKNFHDNLIPQLTIVPLGKKTPWRIVSVPAAIATLGELKILESQDISEARLANLYALLACSANHLALNPALGLASSASHWKDITNESYKRAEKHMQMSLQEETGAKPEKFKDQFMAICAMTEFAIMSNLYRDARCYMLDAERLLSRQGLAKCRVSQKARLLLNVYTWLRIMAESTYVLHDYDCSDAFIQALNSHFGPSDGSVETNVDGEHRLDDFLHLPPRHSDSDLDINAPKDHNMDILDYHLQDSRVSSESLYGQVYGIPETWLSLVSQTTRLANVMTILRGARKADGRIKECVWEALRQRSSRLENVIHSFSLRTTRDFGVDQYEGPSALYGSVLRALNAALVILFYRRIRHVHPAILEGQVDKVIKALKEYEAALAPSDQTSLGILWPAYIAGCEAITAPQREAILEIVKNGQARCGLTPFKTAKEIMIELWGKQDDHLATKCGDAPPTWIDIVREQQLSPIFS